MKNFMPSFQNLGGWMPRLLLLVVFGFHGAGKFFTPEGLASLLDLPHIFIYALGSIEIIAALLAFFSPFFSPKKNDYGTRLSGFLVSIIMIAAMFSPAHFGKWSFVSGGMELPFVFLLVGLILLFRGRHV